MAFWDGTLGVAVGLFVLLALAEYAKYRQRRDRAFRLLGSAGLFFAASVVFGLGDPLGLNYNTAISNIFLFLGELSTLAAVVFLVLDSLKDWMKDIKG